MRIAIVADDLTGANDTAVAFARRGFRVATVLDTRQLGVPDGLPGSPRPEAPPGDAAGGCSPPYRRGYDVIAFSTESRALEPEASYLAVFRAVRSLEAYASGSGKTILYKKIDSALRGPIAAELSGLLDALARAHRILVAPAFPAAGRTTVDGVQRLDGRPVHLTPMADDPLNPVRLSHIPTLLSPHGVHCLSRSVVAAGAGAVRADLAKIPGDVRFVVADAVCDDDLDTLARVVLEDSKLVPCGSAGLAAAIARNLSGHGEIGEGDGRTGSRAERCPVESIGPAGRRGGLLLVVGSKSPRAHGQLRALFEKAPWVEHVLLPPESLSAEEAVDGAARRAASVLARGGACALYLGARGAPVDRPLPDPKAITRMLGRVVRKALISAAVDTLFLSGGETTADVLTGLGAAAMEIREEPWPGVAAGRIVGGLADGTRVMTKAGSFGGDGLLVQLAQSWRNARKRTAP